MGYTADGADPELRRLCDRINELEARLADLEAGRL